MIIKNLKISRYLNEQKINPFEETDRRELEERDKIRLASLNGDGENCEAANGVKFVEIHFSSVENDKDCVGVLPRRTPSPFPDRGRAGKLVKH